MSQLFKADVQVLNVGLATFAEDIKRAGGKAAHVDWRPPAKGDRAVGLHLAELVNHPIVEPANAVAFDR